MKYVKMLGLLVVAIAAQMAFAGGASATTVTGPEGETTPTIHAEAEGHTTIDPPPDGSGKIECPSTFQSTIQSHGSGLTAAGAVTFLSFNNCTNSYHVTVITTGSLEIHYKALGEGVVTSSGMTVDSTRLGITCTFVTNNTPIGILTDSSKTGGSFATLHIEAKIAIHKESSVLCGKQNATWTGAYKTTKSMFIHQ